MKPRSLLTLSIVDVLRWVPSSARDFWSWANVVSSLASIALSMCCLVLWVTCQEIKTRVDIVMNQYIYYLSIYSNIFQKDYYFRKQKKIKKYKLHYSYGSWKQDEFSENIKIISITYNADSASAWKSLNCLVILPFGYNSSDCCSWHFNSILAFNETSNITWTHSLLMQGHNSMFYNSGRCHDEWQHHQISVFL